MRIAELFYSIQGEGRLVGVPSVFIRTSGCNLRCVWCDTPYTSWRPEGTERSVAEIIAAVRQQPTRYVVITGGEPLLAPEIIELTHVLKQDGYHITIETAGTIFKPVVCDLMSLSPKLAHSTPWRREGGRFAERHEQQRLVLPVFQQFIDRYTYQLKFVVDREEDCAEIQTLLAQLKNLDSANVLLMAQAKSRKQLNDKAHWLVERCKELGYGYSPRLHIDLFGNRRGT